MLILELTILQVAIRAKLERQRDAKKKERDAAQGLAPSNQKPSALDRFKRPS